MTGRALLLRFLWIGLTSFGAARWTNLHAAFVARGLITEEQFMRDFAVTQTMPGAPFLNQAALCGLRLSGLPMAFLGVFVLLVPGVVTIVLAMAFLSSSDAWVGRVFHGILVGAVGVLAATLVRSTARNIRDLFAFAVAVATALLSLAGMPLVVTIFVILSAGIAIDRALVRRAA